MKRQWIFPAITCLLLCFLVLSFSKVTMILLFLWVLRIYFLQNFPIQKHTLICVLFIVVSLFFYKKNQFSDLNGKEEQLIIYPELTSILIDGDYLKFDGRVLNNEGKYQESIVVQHSFKSEKEKRLWETNPPNDFLLITGELKTPKTNTNFYQFNYQEYLSHKQVFWQLRMSEYKEISFTEMKKPLFSIIENIRYKILLYIERNFTNPTSNYIKTLFFADKRSMSDEVMENFKVLGILHLFSISGFHITFLAKIIRNLLLKINTSIETADTVTVIFLLIYGVLVGFGTSVFRAVFQTNILLLSKKLKLNIDILDAWSMTMILAMILKPSQILNLSFQLSYLISGGLIFLSLTKWVQELSPIKSAFVFSVYSYLISLPLLIYHFYEISWLTFVSNFVVIPLFSFLFFPFLFILFLVSFILRKTLIFGYLLNFSNQIITIIETIIFKITNISNFTLIVGRLPIIIMLVLIISILKLLINIEQKKKVSMISICGLFLSLFYHTISPVGYVLTLDVGQGDSIIIKEPNSQNVTMIDTGGEISWNKAEAWQEKEKDFSVGENIVVPSLKSFGISEIDRMYISHAHEDHMGELEEVHKSIRIKEIAGTEETLKADNLREKILNIQNISYYNAKVPEKVHLPTKETILLSPKKNYNDKNNQSLVIYVKMGEDYWLFTGDMEKEAENDFINLYPPLDIDYLKVAHHGSATSSTESFITHVQPKNALISAGENNRYNHPDEEVIERLVQNNVNINTTAKDGAIIVRYLKLPFVNRWIVKKETAIKN